MGSGNGGGGGNGGNNSTPKKKQFPNIFGGAEVSAPTPRADQEFDAFLNNQPDRRRREEEISRGLVFEKQQLTKSAEALQSRDRAGSTRDPDFGAKAPAPAPQMGRSPGAFQAMLGSTGQGAKDAAALSGRSEFGSKSNYNALGKVVSEARGETDILIPSVTTVGGAILKRAMNETMLQRMIRGGKPVFKSGNIVGVDENGTFTGQASASPLASKPTIEQQTRDDPAVTPEITPEVIEDDVTVSGDPTIMGRSKRRTRGKRSGLAGKTDEYGILVTT